MDKVYILFYEAPTSQDCNVVAAFKNKQAAVEWLKLNNWYFNVMKCSWFCFSQNGFIEILERELR